MKEDNVLPIIPLKDIVLFPFIVVPLFIGRKKSLDTLDTTVSSYGGEEILLTAQKNSDIEIPKPDDLYKVGVVAKIIQIVRLPNNTVKLLVEAKNKVTISNINDDEGYLRGSYEIIYSNDIKEGYQHNNISKNLVSIFKKYVSINKQINPEILNTLSSRKSLIFLTSIIMSHLTCNVKKKQQILETPEILDIVSQLKDLINKELLILKTEETIQKRVKTQIEKTQKDYYLNEQIKAIQKELGDYEEKSELQDLETKIKSLKLSEEAKSKAKNELKKYRMMNPISSEAAIIRNYLDALLSMPWGKESSLNISINKAENILNKHHHGLQKPKERIIEYLSVLKRVKTAPGTILCFVGPPGVGKTSLAKSIAEATGKEYTKFSLGGVRDESEIRGHRRTYIGSIPGKIMTLLKKAKVDNPVMLLDEIDKISSDYRGDPASALLEVLDPEQNSKFTDHYLEVEYNLSKVMFIATANTLDIPKPLLDRMEVIRLSGYLEQDKLEIAKHYLLAKQKKIHGLKDEELSISDQTILELIRYYTRESGIRSLERQIASLSRKALTKILSQKNINKISITPKDLKSLLGPKKYRIGLAEKEDIIGTTTGLAYTETGGDLLSIEVAIIPGKGIIKATGKLGEIMQESTQTAFSFFRANAKAIGMDLSILKDNDIHLHVPEGATPKDGPSAGIAIYTSISSLINNIPVKRNVAMTGEITLRGRVLAIGGLREKLLAAQRGGIDTVIIPKDNIHDLEEIPTAIKDNLKIIPVSDAKEVLKIALSDHSTNQT